ncbi:hypothetical protein [Pseudorhodoferax sp. Leaf274]|uniref:hypothetical protein n=1 Tax=Pseudorhodoferax sp. Leaf274 TaxID=1736318 RepID=UPI00070263D3|nr:hypothetical protein [Pseudorhodoferax sp. Leaf274]KQP35615.1 hypothetical protein ASF44_20035 [Pseudorhodoferax sp. Leaf274]
MRAPALLFFCLAATASAWAQAPAGTAPAPLVADQPGTSGTDKRIEHIRIEDKGARIDELRYGGEPQSITVQPLNSAMPAYEIVPHNGARVRPGNERDNAQGNAGQRVWKVLGF